ncbi:type IX secretion system outer membrane channel protein PorV [Dysgonomonas sp. 520]|uniref:type IX secretion system outer membrane channel protein PorV n=1 Tax=Dysgonomonas sp. 520 TaxID=2302931 RepID=UPI00210334B6|nr:type IX secretion system outer membrane channel protein PorV [Dysgonomonas sp. 520]
MKKLIISGVFVFCGLTVLAEDDERNPVNAAMPSMTIAPDARGGGMGDIGAATLPDIYSQHWNPAKYAFHTSKAGASLSYTPWLSKLVDDIALVYATGFYKFGYDDNQAISASIRYFSIGDVDIRDGNGDFEYKVAPYEMAFDVAYSRKLTETFSGSVALRFLRADYTTRQANDVSTAGNAWAADISGYNESYVMLGNAECLLGLGFNISNIGSKISNDGGGNYYFLPANMRLGASLTYPLDDYNTLAFSADINKLLVPTYHVKDGESSTQAQERYSDMSSISGIFKSFGDAPGGFKEELKEINWSLGAEYTYDNKFSIRGGYSYENPQKGNRQYFTAGAGFKMSVFQLDAAYLISTAQNNPLDQTIRFSLSFDMDGLRSLMGR